MPRNQVPLHRRKGKPALTLADLRKASAGMAENYIPRGEEIHEWFGLTYASYLVLPRALLQQMPPIWQAGFVALLRQMDEAFDWPLAPAKRIDVRLRDERGRCLRDPLREYRHPDRGAIAKARKGKR